MRFPFNPASSIPLLGLLAASTSMHFQPALAASTPLAKPAQKKLSAVRYLGFAAYRLTDGHTEAIVVPALGRVMRYGPVGGANLLWNGTPGPTKPGEWRNWGGDKAWPSPQSQWPLSIGHDWPPHPSWDGQGYSSQVLANGGLRINSGIWPGLGCHVTREFRFDANGDFVITQTYEKLSGPPVQLALWIITQVAAPEAIFVAVNPDSTYKKGFHWLTKPETAPEITAVGTELLRVRSNGASTNKIGIDSPLASVVIVSNGLAFRQKTSRPTGNYPDGAQGSGFPVEIFDIGGVGREHYMETELLSPLRVFTPGTRWTNTVRWSLQSLSNQAVDSPEFGTEIGELLRRP